MGLYLVTGAAGFIGSAIAKKLLSNGHRVVTIDNLSTGNKAAIPKGCEFIFGDCYDPNVYKQIPQDKYDAILHIAGQSSGEISFDDPTYDLKTNAEATLHILKFCLTNGCRRVVYASTVSVYGIKPDKAIDELEQPSPESFYGVGKLASEHYLRIYKNYNVDSTSLRLFNVYGPGQNLENLRQGMVSIYLSQMLKNNHIQVKGSSERYRDLVYIDDVVDIFIDAITTVSTFNKIINVGTGVRTTVGDLVQKLVESYGKNTSVEYSGSTAGDVHGIYADNSKLLRLFKRQSMTPLHIGLNRMLEWARGYK